MILIFWYFIATEKNFLKAIKHFLIGAACSGGAIFCLIEIGTLGHFNNWVQSTFGTGGFQRWYYNSYKSFYLWDADKTVFTVLQACICIYFLVMMLVQNENDAAQRKNIMLAYANMVGVCVIEEYRLWSGGSNNAVSFSIVSVTILLYPISIKLMKAGKHGFFRIVTMMSLAVGVIVAILLMREAYVFDVVTEKDGIFVKEMDGSLTLLGDDLLKTDQFLSGESFFATYASAQEVVSNSFQPSGTDYIIHVLGDSQRNKYLAAFNQQDFRYVATIKKGYSDWEYWIERANWFFYRELYENWHPVFANAYEVYWEKNAAPKEHIIQDGIEISVSFLNDATAKIIIQCDSDISGMADVYIDYAVKSRKNFTSYFNILRVLKTENTGNVYASDGSYFESNFLRDRSAEYIPVTVVNGYGEVRLTAQPAKSAYLELNDYSCEKIFTVTFDCSDYLYTGNRFHIETIAEE